jgi:protein involved in polysaccharide export with SLBB domain
MTMHFLVSTVVWQAGLWQPWGRLYRSARKGPGQTAGPSGLLPLVLVVFGLLTGCARPVRRLSVADLEGFGMAAPSGPSVDMDRIVEAKTPTGPYRVVPGDILQLEMPQILDPQSAARSPRADGDQSYNCRVNDVGMIVLPIIGPLAVAGSSLAEIESSIMGEYYPRYIKAPFPVYVSVAEYSKRRVSIVGAVARPGIYALRHDQMSLVGLLMEAGGIVEKGAAVIRIARAIPTGPDLPSMGISATARGQARNPGWKQVVPMVSWEPASGRSPQGVRRVGANAIFDWEGPLNTAGWLIFEDGGTVRIRKYVDLGSELQRLAFLETAAAESRSASVDELQARLIELARHLEAEPPGQDARLRMEVAGWETADGRHFEALLLDDSADKDARSSYENTAVRAEVAEDVTRFALPVKGLNVPFVDAALQEGDSVVVESPIEQYISVVGLVNRPGNMPCPPDARYNLIQAIAFAGGLDLVADPRYVSVYRLRPNGAVASATLRLVNPRQRGKLTEALALPLRPGDVVSIEHTARTRTNVFLDRFFRVSLGLYLNPETLWGNG